jgi:hypothetical protein
LITFQRSVNNESDKGPGSLALILSPLSLHANAIKTSDKRRAFFFIASDKIKKSNLAKPKLDFYKKNLFFTG